MKKKIISILVFGLAITSSYSQNKNSETGFLLGIGNSILLNSEFDSYYTRHYNSMLEYSVFYRINFPEKLFSYQIEYTMQSISSPYEFNENINGIAEQGIVGFNLKGSINRRKNPELRILELFLGTGIYTVMQNRIPDSSSGLKIINDGFASYTGISFNGELKSSVPVDKYQVGMSWRFFVLPNITFFNSKNVPEFYHFGTSISLFSTF